MLFLGQLGNCELLNGLVKNVCSSATLCSSANRLPLLGRLGGTRQGAGGGS